MNVLYQIQGARLSCPPIDGYLIRLVLCVKSQKNYLSRGALSKTSFLAIRYKPYGRLLNFGFTSPQSYFKLQSYHSLAMYPIKIQSWSK